MRNISVTIDAMIERDMLLLQQELKLPHITPLILRYAIIEDKIDGTIVYPKGVAKKDYLHREVMYRLTHYAKANMLRD